MRYRVYCDEVLIHDTYIPDASMHLIEAKCKLGDNTAGSFDFKAAPSNPGYDVIKRLTSTIIIYEDNEIIWTGRVVSESEDFWKRRSFTCEGALAYLNDTYTNISSYSNITLYNFFRTLLNNHNGKITNQNRKFNIGTITMEDSDSGFKYETNNESTWDTISKTFINRLGGHLRVRYNNDNPMPILDYYDDYPNTSSQEINFGVNLLDFTKDWDMSDIATVILPRGKQLDTNDDNGQKQYVSIKSVNGGSEYLKNNEAYNTYGRIERIVDFNDIDDPATLLKMANVYVRGMQFDTMTIKVSAVDLHHIDPNIVKFSVLDNVHCVSRPHGLDRDFPITKKEIDINSPSNTLYTLGSSNSNSMSGTSAASATSAKDRLDSLDSSGDVLALAKVQATDILNQRTTGYVNIVQQNDISQALIISDRENYTDRNAKLWKFDMNGLGYSPNADSNGNRQYSFAITSNGVIVADFIKTGVLSDGLGTNYWNLGTGELSIQGSKISINNGGTGSYSADDMFEDFTSMNSEVAQVKTKSNTALSTATEAKTKSNTALSTATEAKTTANQTKEQYNIIAGREYGCVNLLNGSGVLSIGNAKWDSRKWATSIVVSGGAGTTTTVTVVDATRTVIGINPPNTMILKALRCRFTGYERSSRRQITIKQITVPLEPDTVYVASMYVFVKNFHSSSGSQYGAYGTLNLQGGLKAANARSFASMSTIVIPENRWVRVSKVFTTTRSTTDSKGLILNVNDTVDVIFGVICERNAYFDLYMCGFKIEKGNTPTDWFPSVKDIDSTATEYTKKYADNIGTQAKNETARQMTAYDNKLRYEKLLSKLTSGYQRTGIYQGKYKNPTTGKVDNKLSLLINASYIRTGALDAGLITTGWIRDKLNRNKWNLVTGYLETRNMKAINIQASGSFETGTNFKLQFTNGKIDGYRNKSWVGSISPTAAIHDISENKTYYGLQLRANGVLDIRSPSLSIRNRNDNGVSTTTKTGEISFKYIHAIWQDYSGGPLHWNTRTFRIKFINGLITAISC